VGLFAWLVQAERSSQPSADGDSEAPGLLQLALLHAAKRVRGVRTGVRARRSVGCPGREKSPGKHPVAFALTASGATRDSRKGQSPEVGACRAGPRVRPREQRQVKRQVGSSQAETSGVPFGRGTLRRAKSQERCRHETRPARVRGE
jgi:hypothetical protein